MSGVIFIEYYDKCFLKILSRDNQPRTNKGRHTTWNYGCVCSGVEVVTDARATLSCRAKILVRSSHSHPPLNSCAWRLSAFWFPQFDVISPGWRPFGNRIPSIIINLIYKKEYLSCKIMKYHAISFLFKSLNRAMLFYSKQWFY